MLVKPGGGLVGAVVFLGTFHSSWDREACVWEIGPEDHVDLMSDSLPATENKRFVCFQLAPMVKPNGNQASALLYYSHFPRDETALCCQLTATNPAHIQPPYTGIYIFKELSIC